jgi:hypothetical protein
MSERALATAQKQSTALVVPGAPSHGGILQRKCACGNHTMAGGECAECSKTKPRLQRKLTIGASNDPLELEADRVADRVMAASVHSPTGYASARVQRDAGPSAGVGDVAPPSVERVLASPGASLQPKLREDMEQRFGYDFSRVRVHTDAKAAESARSVNALAYTVGRDLVFGEGQYAPGGGIGRRLIAHELTHVVQQSGAERRPPASLSVPAPHDVVEQAAHHNAQAVEHGLDITRQTSRPVLARFVPAAEAEAEAEVEVEPEAEAEAEPAPGGGGQSQQRGSPGGANQAGQRRQQRAYAQSRSFNKMYEAAKKAPNYDAAVDELERPAATLERGGASPDFVTISQKEATTSISGGPAGSAGNITVRYKPHWFHVLDAIEHDVAAVSSSDELIDVFRAYFPESVLSAGRSIAGRANYRANISLKWGTDFDPAALDPSGRARTLVFTNALAKKSAANPKISPENLVKVLIQEWELHEKSELEERKKRLAGDKGKECSVKEVDRKGGNQDHDSYAKAVTGADKDCQITAPDGTQCTTDGRELMNPRSVWEVKTGHEWATSYGIPGAIFAPYFSGQPSSRGGQNEGRIMKIEEQRLRCLAVTSVCGFGYSYAFETKEAADFMKAHWSTGGPPVYHKPR